MFQNIAILEAWGKKKRKFYLIDAELNRKTCEYKRVCTHYNILQTIIR